MVAVSIRVDHIGFLNKFLRWLLVLTYLLWSLLQDWFDVRTSWKLSFLFLSIDHEYMTWQFSWNPHRNHITKHLLTYSNFEQFITDQFIIIIRTKEEIIGTELFEHLGHGQGLFLAITTRSHSDYFPILTNQNQIYAGPHKQKRNIQKIGEITVIIQIQHKQSRFLLHDNLHESNSLSSH